MTLVEFRQTYPAATFTVTGGKPFTYRYYQNPQAKATLVLPPGGIGLSDLFYKHFVRFARDFSVLTFDYQMPFADNSEFARHRSRAAHAVRGRRHLHHGLPRGFDRPDVRHRRGHGSRQRPPGADSPVEGIRQAGV